MTQYEYLARNLKKVAGMMLENDFNKHGAEGWRFVAVAEGYAIFIREKRDEDNG
jgi:hypothetical protein